MSRAGLGKGGDDCPVPSTGFSGSYQIGLCLGRSIPALRGQGSKLGLGCHCGRLKRFSTQMIANAEMCGEGKLEQSSWITFIRKVAGKFSPPGYPWPATYTR